MKEKTKYISTKHYGYAFAKYLGYTFLIFLICLMGGLVLKNHSYALMYGIVCGMIFLTLSVYYLISGIFYTKKAAQTPIHTGTVANWDHGFSRNSGNISVKVEDNEYASPTFFSAEEARDLVGKQIAYCVINETLFIVDIISEANEAS